jgi:hypothetical protein
MAVENFLDVSGCQRHQLVNCRIEYLTEDFEDIFVILQGIGRPLTQHSPGDARGAVVLIGKSAY